MPQWESGAVEGNIWTQVWQLYHLASGELCSLACIICKNSLACLLPQFPSAQTCLDLRRSGLWVRVCEDCRVLCPNHVWSRQHPLELKSTSLGSLWGCENGTGRFTYFHLLVHQDLDSNSQERVQRASCNNTGVVYLENFMKQWIRKIELWVLCTFYSVIYMPVNYKYNKVCFLDNCPVPDDQKGWGS